MNKREELEGYKTALNKLNHLYRVRWPLYCICPYLPGSMNDIPKNYPLLWSKKPKKNPSGLKLEGNLAVHSFWYPHNDIVSRRKVLNECISELTNTINKLNNT